MGRWRNLSMSMRGVGAGRPTCRSVATSRPGQEDAPPVGRHDEAGDGRIVVAEGDDQVGDLADRLALRVAHRAARSPGSGRAWLSSSGVRRPPTGTAPSAGPLAGAADLVLDGAWCAVATGSGLHGGRCPPLLAGPVRRRTRRRARRAAGSVVPRSTSGNPARTFQPRQPMVPGRCAGRAEGLQSP